MSLGGNEGEVISRLHRALYLLSTKKEIFNLMTSHFYHTAPVNVESEAWFVNAVCTFQTELKPKEVFDFTQRIENELGKVKKPKNAPRPIDIDVLFYGEQFFQEESLEIPHPRWKERLFVLIPLADLTDRVVLRRSKTIQECYVLEELIQFLCVESNQMVSLLEKNPGFQ